MAKAASKTTSVDRLRKAGLLHSKHKLTKAHEARINKLSTAEVDSLVRLVNKTGQKKSTGTSSRAWFV